MSLRYIKELTSFSTMGARLSSGDAEKADPIVAITNFWVAAVKRSGRKA